MKWMCTPVLLVLAGFLPEKALCQDTLSLIFTGDIMGHQAQITSARQPDGTYNYDPCFQYVRPYWEAADLAVGNLEVTLSAKKRYTGHRAPPVFRSPDALAYALKNAGIDVLMTANNHANDGNRHGLKHGIELLRQLGIKQTGTFLNETERDSLYPLVVKEKGFTLVFLNFTFVGTNFRPTISPGIVNNFDTTEIKKDLAKARSIQPDAIIAVAHWGIEHNIIESPLQIQQARFLAQHGVDFIIGMHPHAVQPIKTILITRSDSSIHETLVAYSLGNLISNHQEQYADGGLLLQLQLIRDKAGAVCFNWQSVPVWRHIYLDPIKGKGFTVIPIPDWVANPERFPFMTAADKTALLLFKDSVME